MGKQTSTNLREFELKIRNEEKRSPKLDLFSTESIILLRKIVDKYTKFSQIRKLPGAVRAEYGKVRSVVSDVKKNLFNVLLNSRGSFVYIRH